MPKKITKIIFELLFIGIVLTIASRFVGDEIKEWLQKQLNQNFAANPKLKTIATWSFIVIIFLLYILYKLWTEDIKKPDYKILKENRKELLENIEYVYDNALKVKLHNDLKHKIDVVLRYSKEGTTEDFIKDDFVPGFEERQLTDFTELYNDVETQISRLLILGEPGSGKSTLLLQFAKKLVDSAKKDENHPIPVLLNLSSWSGNYKSFEDWLENNLQGLSGIFSISKTYSHSLAHSNQLILLLDGFDEISQSDRLHFFLHLKIYLNKISKIEWVRTQLVLCSRIEEYVQIEKNAPVQAAVKIQPIKADKIIELLTEISKHNPIRKNAAEKLLRDISHNEKLPQLINTAFNLNIALNTIETNLDTCRTEKQLLDAYVNEQIAKLTNKYPRKTIVRALHWLSIRQQKHKLGLKFELSNMSVSWTRYSVPLLIIFTQILALMSHFGFLVLAPLNHYSVYALSKINYFWISLVSILFFYFAYAIIDRDTIVVPPSKFGYRHIYWRNAMFLAIVLILIIIIQHIPTLITVLSGQSTGILPEQWLASLVLYLSLYIYFIFSIDNPLPFQTKPLSRFVLSFQSSLRSVTLITAPLLLTMVFIKAFSITSLLLIFPAVLIYGVMLFSGLLLYILLYFFIVLENRIPFNMIRFLNSIAENTGLLEKEGSKWRYKHLLIQDWFLHRI